MFGWSGTDRKNDARMSDSSGAVDGAARGVMSGLLVGTRVATSQGWRDVGALQEGDLVLTFDSGLQPVTGLVRTPIWSGETACPKTFWPLLIPAGALENAKSLRVLPRQGVVLESDLAEEVLGDPLALIPAQALDGVRGIERVDPDETPDVINLQFDADQVIFAQQGALLFCPAGGDLLLSAISGPTMDCPYNMLSEPSATHLAQRISMREFSDRCLESFRAKLGPNALGSRAVA